MDDDARVRKRQRTADKTEEVPIAQLGFGTYKLTKEDTEEKCAAALKAGYRLIDTAQIYGNEKFVGQAVKASEVPREEIFITTKVWRSSHGYDRTMKSVKKSARALGVGYIDLVLVHWPGPKTGWPLKRGTVCPPEWTPELRVTGTWKALEELVDEGLVKRIGVANYSVRHLKELLAACRIQPAVNQVECHPLLQQRPLREFCSQHGIAVQAFASLGSGDNPKGHARVMALRPVVEAARSLRRTPAQVLLRWAIQSGVSIIPKSSNAKRIRENAKLFDFELSASQMSDINQLDEGTRFTWKGADPDAEV